MKRAETDGLVLSRQQQAALSHVTESRDLGIVVGYAGASKSALLGVAREAWKSSGLGDRLVEPFSRCRVSATKETQSSNTYLAAFDPGCVKTISASSMSQD